MRITRRGLQIALAVLWLVDGALQLQPFMFGHGFARDVIAPAGQGQPEFVSAAVNWSARLIDSQPVVCNCAFAAAQLALGAGLLVRATARVALAASIAWSLGVWYFGEGLGGLASGHADLLTGAPGAVLLYAVLAGAAWPVRGRVGSPPAAWLPAAWAALWVGGALLRALPGQGLDRDVAAEIGANADGAPGWLARLDQSIAGAVGGSGRTVVIVLVIVEVLIGLGALRRGTPRTVACAAGIVVSAAFWVVGQSFGGLYTGQATDPNIAPVVILFAVAVLGVRNRVEAAATVASRPHQPAPILAGSR